MNTTRTDPAQPRQRPHWPDADVLSAGTDYDFFAKALRVAIGVEAGTTDYQATFPEQGGVDLAKADGELHELRRHGDLLTCTCSDYMYRRGPSGSRCKHGVALQLLGLI